MVLKLKLKRRNPQDSKQLLFDHQLKNQPVVVNKNLEKQNSLQNLPLIPGKRNYCEAAQPRPSPYNTLIFTDNIPKGIRMYEFNSLLRNGKIKILNFPRSSLH